MRSLALLLAGLLVAAALVPINNAEVAATQFVYMSLHHDNSVLDAAYIITGTGKTYLYVVNPVNATFNNGTVVEFNAGTYNLTGQDVIVRLESVNQYVQIYSYEFNNTIVEVEGIKTNNGAVAAGMIACGFLNVSIESYGDTYSWKPSSAGDVNKLKVYLSSSYQVFDTWPADKLPLLCNNTYFYVVSMKTLGSKTTIGANITASDWGIYAPTPSTVTVTTTATTTATVTETVTEAATMTVTETVSLAATETTVPTQWDYGRLAAIGAGLAFVLLLIIAAMVRR